jgi:hypothetical protein
MEQHVSCKIRRRIFARPKQLLDAYLAHINSQRTFAVEPVISPSTPAVWLRQSLDKLPHGQLIEAAPPSEQSFSLSISISISIPVTAILNFGGDTSGLRFNVFIQKLLCGE